MGSLGKLQGLPFHDGLTGYDDEDVGWMHMSLLFYMDEYENFHDGWWGDIYVRPPFINGTEDNSNMVGHWRRKKDVTRRKRSLKADAKVELRDVNFCTLEECGPAKEFMMR